MGEQSVRAPRDAADARAFTQAVLRDLEALEVLLEQGRLTGAPLHAGVEQEMFLVGDDGRPAPVAREVLARATDARLVHELALFNLEANLPPVTLGGDFLGRMEADLRDVVGSADRAAREEGARVVLAGVLPSLRRADLRVEMMTPEPRYQQLDRELTKWAGGSFHVRIRGVDELELFADSIMFEAANTSCQLHLQTSPDTFVRDYNLAQFLAGPVLAAAVNSPFLLGRRLWRETRIALFEQSVDVRSRAAQQRNRPRRVGFGSAWVTGSILELLRENAMRFPPFFALDLAEDPLDVLAQGRLPDLRALSLHNGTVWRWNRPCLGISGDAVHLRVENRVLPSGPTVLDEVANAALWFGAMRGFADSLGDPAGHLEFAAARANLFAAAREGLEASFTWLDGQRYPASDVLRREVLPVARDGLRALEVPEEHVARYLGTVEERVRTGRTGAAWVLETVSGHGGPEAEGVGIAVVVGLLDKGWDATPVHTWSLAGARPGRPGARLVEDVMSTDLYTLRPGDPVALAARAMLWRKVRHLPIESERGELVGLLSSRDLLRASTDPPPGDPANAAVADLMDPAPVIVPPELPLEEALRRMLAASAECVLVVDARAELVGLVSEVDFTRAALEDLEG